MKCRWNTTKYTAAKARNGGLVKDRFKEPIVL